MAIASAIAHLVILGLVFQPSDDASATAEVGAVDVSLLAGPRLPRATTASRPSAATDAPPPDATPPPEVIPQYVESVPAERDPLNDPVALAVAAAASGAAGQPCQLGEWLRAALQTDPDVLAALAQVPRPARSVANAVMLWDGAWVPPPPAARQEIEAVRSAVRVGLRSAPEACRLQEVRGPELIALTDASGSTVLAIGSGAWRWNDLLEPEATAPILPRGSRIQ